MFDYILKNYGWFYAEKFYNEAWRDQFAKAEVAIDLCYPHCRYTRDKQCDLNCPYFNGMCTWEEDQMAISIAYMTLLRLVIILKD